MTVSSGKQVSIEYTLWLEDDTVVDSNVGGAPLVYTHGAHQIVPGLEDALEGMQVGETRIVTVFPEEGYGERDPKAFHEVDKGQFPAEALKVGTAVRGRDPEGQEVRALVAEIREGTVLLDLNHPLAGKTLYFDVKVIGVQEPPTS